MINKQKIAAPLFTKYSTVNPMAPTITALESRQNPALRRSTVSQRTRSILAKIPAPVACQAEARSPDLALRGTVQTPYSAVHAPTCALLNPLGAQYTRITTQNYPREMDTDPTEDASNTRITTQNYPRGRDTGPTGDASYARITTQNYLRATDTEPTATHGLETRSDTTSARTVHAQAAPVPHTLRAMTRKRTRTLQFLDLDSANSHSRPTIPAPSPHKLAQGKRRKLMEPAPWMRFHPFVATLEQWASGVSAVCGEPWSEAAIQAAIDRGPHTSALTPEARNLIDEEMEYQIQAGFSEMVLWSAIQHSYPLNLKVSPLAVIPQVGRRGRLLLDLSFPSQAARPASKRQRRNWVVPPPLAPSVNSTTIQQSPAYPVKELGRVLPRLLAFMSCVPREETIMFAKIDLSDGFWRMLVRESDKWNFTYVLPGAADAPLRLIIPHALQMGWTESPGYFCATTETGRDILQALIDGGTWLPPHVFDSYMSPEAVVRRQSSPVTDRPWQMSAVYVDDYILAAVENAEGSTLQRTGRAALHTIHGLFPPPDRSGHVSGKDPISLKKLEAGDARWAQAKELLGFVFDGQSRTVHLTQRKALGITEAITRLLKKTRAPVQKFQSVVGKMRHVATILPSARSLFTPLNRALRGNPSTISLSASGEVRAALLDLRQLITTLAARPTHVMEILPAPDANYIGYCDASAFGAGGVWFSGTNPLPETVWRLQWPLDITAAVVSESNPTGTLTNSDLEMAAVVLQLNVLEPLVPSMHHKSLQIHSDNTPSVAWLTKMATKTANSDAAHRLVRGLALRQRMLHSAPVSITHVAGADNNLADIASQAITHLDDDHAFLTHFDNLFPLQERFWQRASPPPAQLSNVISTLRGQRLTMQRWTLPLAPPVGAGGNNTVPIVERIRGCATRLPRSAASYSWDLPPGLVLDTLGKAGKLEPRLSKKPCVTWHKPSCWRDTQTPAEPAQEPTWLCPLPTSLNPSGFAIPPQNPR